MNQGWGQGPFSPQQPQHPSQHPSQYPPQQQQQQQQGYAPPQQYQQQQGYAPQQPQGYPPPQPQGYPPPQAQGYPPPQAQGYPPPQPQGFAPPPQPSYPAPQPSYPAPQPSYPAAQPSYPAAAPTPVFTTPAAEVSTSGGFISNLSIMTKIRLGLAALGVILAIPVMGWGFWTSSQQNKSFVVFENGMDAAVELSVDGKSFGSIPAHGSVSKEVPVGSHAVAVTGGGTEQGSFAVPQKAMFRGLYTIGGKGGQVAVVTKYYSESGDSPFEDKIEVVPAGMHFMELPGNMSISALEMDKAFPDTIPVTKGAMAVSVIHLCHVDPKVLNADKEPKLGCSGY